MSADALLKKLTWREGRTGRSIARPQELEDVLPFVELGEGEAPDVIVAFVTSSADVEARMEKALAAYRAGNALWFAYPKKSGAIRADISRDHGWEPLAARDLLPVTQVAIDADWSALRFRRRDEIKRLTRASERTPA